METPIHKTDPSPYDLDSVLAEITADERVDHAAKRILSHDDIQRLVEESRRRRKAAEEAQKP
jgi:hypothetical protein